MKKKEYRVSCPDLSHFPTKEQLFVFRNWDCVPVSKLASVLSATEQQIEEMASDLGLPLPQPLNPEYELRGKVTIIRNNWHLLPYDQLQQLLDWDWETLQFELKENDFLDVKLGSKPEVPPLRWKPLTQEERLQTRRLKQTITRLQAKAGDKQEFDFIKEFASPVKRPSSPMHQEVLLDNHWSIVNNTNASSVNDYQSLFLRRMKNDYNVVLEGGTKQLILELDPSLSPVSESRQLIISKERITVIGSDEVGVLRGLTDLLYMMEKNGSPSLQSGEHRFIPQMKERIVSPFTLLFADPLLEDTAVSCPDGLLEEYALLGINGIWLHSVLYKLTEFPFDPSISTGWEKRLENLSILAQRAKRFGIKIYLYFNEPRAMPFEFFDTHPDLLGRKGSRLGSLCTQNEKVQAYLRNAVQTICRKVPILGGFFAITRSENQTNCYSHTRSPNCPVCSKLTIEKVIGDLMVLLADSAKQINPAIDVIAWTWVWDQAILDHEYMAELFARHKIKLMATSEERCERTYGNYTTRVIDYSISIPGPGDYARNLWEIYRKHGVEIMAKTQMNVTWECACVPYYPVWDLIRTHYQGLCDSKVSGLFLGWSLGGYPGGMLRMLSRYMTGDPDASSITAADFKENAPLVLKAMRDFSNAFSHFPFSCGTAYSGPQQMGPANLLYEKDTFLSSTMTCYSYDDLYHWKGGTSGFPVETYIDQMGKLATLWNEAFRRLKQAISPSEVEKNQKLSEFFTVSEALGDVYQSCYNQCLYILARDRYHAMEDGIQKEKEREVILSLLDQEKHLSENLLMLTRKNSSLGFESANQYFFNQLSLIERVINCEELSLRFAAKQ